MKPPSNDLAHFGIKGMKWGVRRGDSTSGSSPKKALTPEQQADRRKRNVKIAVGAVVAARVLFVVGSMAAATVLQNRAAMNTGMRALERSNMIRTAASRGVFKVTTL